jgi:hypothetical protein
VYKGTGGTKMIHFVTEFYHQATGHRAVSEQSLIDLINLGFQELRDGKLSEAAATPRLKLGRLP